MKKKFKFIPRKFKPKNSEITTITFEEIIAISRAENEYIATIRAKRDSNINFNTANVAKIWYSVITMPLFDLYL